MIPGTYRYVLARWVWVDSAGEQLWQPPAGAIAAVDMRPVPAQALRGTQPAEGFGFFALNPAAPVPAGALDLGLDLSAAIATATKRDSEARLGLSTGDLGASTLLEDGWAVITSLADTTGANRVKPLMPTVAGDL